MRVRFTALLLALALLGSLVVTASAADEAELDTEAEAAAKGYSVSLSARSLDFGSYTLPEHGLQQEDMTARSVTMTNTGSKTIYFWEGISVNGASLEIRDPRREEGGSFSGNPSTALEPGESYTVTFQPVGALSATSISGTIVLTFSYEPAVWVPAVIGGEWHVTANLRFQLPYSGSVGYPDVERLVSVSTDSINLGSFDVSQGTPRPTFTVTNICDYTVSLSFRRTGNFTLEMESFSEGVLEPGQTMTAALILDPDDMNWMSSSYTGEITLDAVFTLDRKRYEQTVTIPVTFEALVDGGYQVAGHGDGLGRGVSEDGYEFYIDDYKGVTVPAGGSLTINLVPYNAGNTYPMALEVDGEFVTAEGSYTFSNLSGNLNFVAYFGQGKAPADWARTDVGRARVLGLIPEEIYKQTWNSDKNAYDSPDFSRTATRGQFCQMAYRLFGKVTGKYADPDAIAGIQFSDTNEAYIKWMAYLGVMEGVGGGRFDPDGLLTREQAAIALARLAAAMGHELPAASTAFADNAAISSWAADAVGRMQGSGIMTGVGGGRFAPQQEYSCEQSVVTMMRLYDYVALE